MARTRTAAERCAPPTFWQRSCQPSTSYSRRNVAAYCSSTASASFVRAAFSSTPEHVSRIAAKCASKTRSAPSVPARSRSGNTLSSLRLARMRSSSAARSLLSCSSWAMIWRRLPVTASGSISGATIGRSSGGSRARTPSGDSRASRGSASCSLAAFAESESAAAARLLS